VTIHSVRPNVDHVFTCSFFRIACDGQGEAGTTTKKGESVVRNESWEHLVLHMKGSSGKVQATLVFSDFRMFGRVLFHAGDSLPQWWTCIAPAISSSDFTRECVAEFMKRRSGITIKAALLMQERFPGIGNWMADEILWRACIHPSKRCGDLAEDEIAVLHTVCVWVCKQALAIIGTSFADPPPTWLYHYRWQDGGKCPLTGAALQRETIGGRTSCFCASRQKMKGGGLKHVFMDDTSIESTALVKSSAWKAHASSSSSNNASADPPMTSSMKHGKQKVQAALAGEKLKREDEEISASVSPWSKQVRKRVVNSASAKVTVEAGEELPRKRVKIEENMIVEETKPVLKKARRNVIKQESPSQPQRRGRAPAVKAVGAAPTERQQMLRLVRESQQQTQPRNEPKIKKPQSQKLLISSKSKSKVKREM
jgi:formamidopyrimidine-DNA glycosylase